MNLPKTCNTEVSSPRLRWFEILAAMLMAVEISSAFMLRSHVLDCHTNQYHPAALSMIGPSSPREARKKSRSAATEKLASLSLTPFPSQGKKPLSKGHNATSWSHDSDTTVDNRKREYNPDISTKKSPMPSSLFRDLAQSQFELLSHSLVHNGDVESIKPSTPKTSSMVLYLPRENQQTGQLEFVTAVTYEYPNRSSGRVFIASDSSKPQIVPPIAALRLPGFSNARDLIPNYPFISASDESAEISGQNDVMFAMISQDSSIGVSVVEEISPEVPKLSMPTTLSVTLFSGLDTLGVLTIWPYRSEDDKQNQWTWSDSDKLQVTRAAKSLALALSMDSELTTTRVQSEQFRMAFADSLHQVKSPIQALRTFGKLLQRQLALEDSANGGPAMRRVSHDASSEEYESSWNRRHRQALKLAQDMVREGERVVDLIQPIDTLINEQYLLPASTTSAIDLYRQTSDVSSNALPMLGDFDLEMVFPQDIIGPLIYASQAISRENGIDLEAVGFDQDAELPGVTISTKYLIEAITNVLDNAMKYVACKCKKRGRGRPSKSSLPRIVVTLTPNEPPLEAGVTLWIEDNGPGISEEDALRIFDRGYRGKELKELVPGSGIGLHVSKVIIQKMGGSLDVLREGPSHFVGGATMRIILFRDPAI